MAKIPSRRATAAGACCAAAIAAITLAMTTPEPARAYTATVENACRDDYFRHCAGYPVGSASLKLCMEAKARDLSRSCVTALVDAGLVDRRRLKRGY